MLKILKKIRSWSLFAKIMIIYSVILIGVIGAFARWEWKRLAAYQNEYDSAKSAGEPDLYLEKYLDTFTYDEYRRIIKESVTAESPYYTEDMLADYTAYNYEEDNIIGVRNQDKWSDTRPVYNILSGGKKILTLTLGVESKDKFGFNRWKPAVLEAELNIAYDKSVDFILDSNMTATINGVKVSDEYITGDWDREFCNIASKVTDRQYKMSKYHVGNLMDGFELKVTDSNGNNVSYTEKDNVRDYTMDYTEEERKVYEARVRQVIRSYVLYTNKLESLENMLSYIVPENPLYETVNKSYSGSIFYVIPPKKVDFNAEQISDIRKISNNLFSCNIHYEIRKDYGYESDYISDKWQNETVEYTLFFRKVNGIWLLDTMQLS